MNKFKEYWIDDILNVNRPYQRTAYQHYDDTDGFHGKTVHVIEYAALESAQRRIAELEEYVSDLERCSDKQSTQYYNLQAKLKTQAEIIDQLQKRVSFMAGYVSTTEGFTDKTIGKILDWVDDELKKGL